MTPLRHVLTLLLAALLAGCPNADPDPSAGTPPADDAPADAAAPGDTSTDATAGLDAMFVAAPPADAQPLLAVKGSAAAGDEVVFEAKIGGRGEPFVSQRAIFTVIDPALPSCADNPDDGCRTPWDYCCETPEDLLKQTATVRLVDADGQPLKLDLQGTRGLTGLATVVVRGTLSDKNDAGVFVVDAHELYVKP